MPLFEKCTRQIAVYFLEDIQPAVLLHAHGIMVNVPAPARFAIHKCVLSQRRKAAFAAKAHKDLLQAEQVFQVLAEDRPGDLWPAFEAAQARGSGFVTYVTGLYPSGDAPHQADRMTALGYAQIVLIIGAFIDASRE